MFPFLLSLNRYYAPEVSRMMYVRGIKGYYWRFGIGGWVGGSESNLKGLTELSSLGE